MSKPEKLTVQLDPEIREELTQWARADRRPVANLLRLIVCESVERRRLAQEQGAPA